jgi:hypothetical protein
MHTLADVTSVALARRQTGIPLSTRGTRYSINNVRFVSWLRGRVAITLDRICKTEIDTRSPQYRAQSAR